MKVACVGPRKIDGKLHRDWVPIMCQHCTNPTCIAACPIGAIERGKDRTITINRNVCGGCGKCVEVCLFGVIQMTQQGNVVKCDLCADRRENGWLPSCVQHCPGRALAVVKEDEKNKAISDRHYFSRGQVVYVSSKWRDLGKGIL